MTTSPRQPFASVGHGVRERRDNLTFSPPARHLLRARDLVDSHYAEPLRVEDLARAARLSRGRFSEEFRRTFGVTPHAYLLSRRLERAAALLRTTDWPVLEICFAVGLRSLGSFTTSFGRAFGMSPAAYRAAHAPAAAYAMVPACVLRAYGTPRHRTFREGRARATP